MFRLNQCLVLLLLACAVRSSAQPRPYSLPEKKGALIITPGMGTTLIELRDEDSQFKVKWDASARLMTMTAFIQPAEAPGDGKVCRATWWPKTERGIVSVAKITDKTFREQGGVALVEYMVPIGKTVNQKHVHAYLAGGDIWAEVHISKVEFKPEDQAQFDAIIDSLQLKPDYINNSRDYWRWGAIKSNNTEYAKAAKYFQRSLDLEKSSPVLDPGILRRMVADLGHFYEKYGDLVKARETLQFGLSKFPDYPLYHYNMACVIALTQKMDESLAELRLAYAKPKSIYPEEQPLPDPLETDCFGAFAKEPRFIQAVREMQQPH